MLPQRLRRCYQRAGLGGEQLSPQRRYIGAGIAIDFDCERSPAGTCRCESDGARPRRFVDRFPLGILEHPHDLPDRAIQANLPAYGGSRCIELPGEGCVHQYRMLVPRFEVAAGDHTHSE
jgi:hypothetical protein